eukprot:TRINITY_DN40938_c0_g1_i1.p1 TRINITY_DN40938_c0_g1~~TRINITY_DN40938_c0_g1_i1.p1  ORF type:complete len:127 (-),score=18.91 TRINITY_DN40938_c0_g1_i1:88-468(-)
MMRSSSATANNNNLVSGGGGGGNSPVAMSTPTNSASSSATMTITVLTATIHPNCPMSILVSSPCTRLGQIYRRHYVGAKGTYVGSVAPTSMSRRSGGGRSVMSVSNMSATKGTACLLYTSPSPRDS